MITQKYNLNLVPGGVPVVANVSQYDSGTRTLTFTIYYGNVLFTIPSNVTARLVGTKPDNHGFSYECTISGSTVSCDVTQQMTAVAGFVDCEIKFIDANQNSLGSANFRLNVEKAALGDDAIMSKSDIAMIEKSITIGDAAIAAASEATTAADKAQDAVSQIGDNVTRSETAATNAEASAKAAKASETNAKTSETNAKTSETNAKTSETNAGDSANVAKDAASTATNAASLAEIYSGFVTPHFVIQDNRLYLKDTAKGEFTLANNRLYMKTA